MATQPKKNNPRLLTPHIQFALAILLFLGAAVSAQNTAMTNAEIGVFNFFYQLPEIVTPFFLLVTQAGNIYALLILALLFIVIRRYHIAVRLFMTGSLTYLLSGVAKDLVGRGRPDEFITDLVFRDMVVRGSSFPSGHVALATALALTLHMYLPQKFKWITPTTIILVAISRMQLGVHGPIDVIGGFAIGWAIVTLLNLVDIRLKTNYKTKR